MGKGKGLVRSWELSGEHLLDLNFYPLVYLNTESRACHCGRKKLKVVVLLLPPLLPIDARYQHTLFGITSVALSLRSFPSLRGPSYCTRDMVMSSS